MGQFATQEISSMFYLETTNGRRNAHCNYANTLFTSFDFSAIKVNLKSQLLLLPVYDVCKHFKTVLFSKSVHIHAKETNVVFCIGIVPHKTNTTRANIIVSIPEDE